MVTVKKLLISIMGVVFFFFSLGLQVAQANIGNSQFVSPQSQSDSIFYGEVKPLGDGTIRTFVKFDKDDVPSEIGVVFTEAALLGLPEEYDHFGSDKFGSEFPLKLTLRDGTGFSTFEYELPFPIEASTTPFTHMALNWNPNGHQPEGIFTAPHFDFHFCMISPKERHSITVDDDFLKKAYKQIPIGLDAEGYEALPLAAEPRMGLHWIDSTAPEFRKKAWTKSFLFGSFDGKIVFLEPMISKTFLETKSNTTDLIKQPSLYPQPGYYPTKYSVSYADGEYSVSLNGLIYRSLSLPNPNHN